MTNIIDETAGWPDVPLINTRDLVLGGPDGPSNKQAIALAARTEFLKESTELLKENQQLLKQRADRSDALVDALEGRLTVIEAKLKTVS